MPGRNYPWDSNGSWSHEGIGDNPKEEEKPKDGDDKEIVGRDASVISRTNYLL